MLRTLLVLLLWPALSAGQTNRIYLGSTAKWYDSFWERYDKSDFPGTNYCQGQKLPGYGASTCEINPGCCYIPPPYLQPPSTEQCVSCQEIRGTWQGVLGTCVWSPIPTVVTYDTVANRQGPTVTANRCVPSKVDPSTITFDEMYGKMATGTSPSSEGNTGQYTFDFQYSRNTTEGIVDIFVSTFFGTRTLYGTFQIRASELGSTLYLALSAMRPPDALPFLSSTVNLNEMYQTVVFFEGYRIQEYMPPAASFQPRRFPAGSCKHTVLDGENLDQIARRYMLTWQEVQAFNGQIFDPESVKPGDIISIGRHHKVRGPCVNLNTRQSGPNDGDVEIDYTCTCTSQTACSLAQGHMRGETLYGIATRYGTSWQRILDVNPQLQICENTDDYRSSDLKKDSSLPQQNCGILPGDQLCIVPYLRNILCGAEYRRFAVLDNQGNSPGYLKTFFSCQPKWSSGLVIDKCCQFPRCKCCVLDKYAGYGSLYKDWGDAPTGNTCDVTVKPHLQCILDPLITAADGVQTYSPLCDDDCQLLCDGQDPTVLDPNCPTQVGITTYTGRCQPVRMASGRTKNVCT